MIRANVPSSIIANALKVDVSGFGGAAKLYEPQTLVALSASGFFGAIAAQPYSGKDNACAERG